MSDHGHPPLANMNGKIVPFGDAKISIMAPGLTFAVLAFEGLRAYWNDDEQQLFAFRVPEHMDRLDFSNAVIEIEGCPDAEKLTAEMLELAEACAFR